MPMPKVMKDETRKDYIKRCMEMYDVIGLGSEEEMLLKYNEEYSEQVGEMSNITSIDMGHLHMYEIDIEGNGTTYDCINCEQWHTHPIQNFMVLPAPDGDEHTHEMLKNNDKYVYKLDTTTVSDVEIFEVGKWKGIEYTKDDLKEVIDNFEKGVIDPYANIDHSHLATSQMKDALKVLSLGWVDKLKLKGDKLIASFKEVPKKIAELIEGGALKKKSIEIFKKYKSGDGQIHEIVLRSVTFLGANGEPALNTLDDFVKLYKKTNEQSQSADSEQAIILKNEDFEKQTKGKVMDTVTINKSEHDELLSKAAKLEELTNSVESFKNEADEFKNKIADLEKENETLNKFKAEAEEKAVQAVNDEAEKYVSSKIDEGKIMPKYKDDYVADYVQYKNENPERLGRFIEDIDNREKLIDNGALKEKGVKSGKVEFKNTEDLGELVEKIMEDEDLSFEDARAKAYKLRGEQ